MRNFKNLPLFILCFIMSIACCSFIDVTKVSEYKWEGIASYYHAKFNGRRTSSGEIFSNQQLSAASNVIPLGTIVKVTNLVNGKSVIVKINDRMNKRNKRLLDLSQLAAKRLAMIHQGLGHVLVEVIRIPSDLIAKRS
jgi:rare lipoprotein A